jgi:hypothetical protein
MADEQRSEEVQRWTAKRRAALVMSLLKGETNTAEQPWTLMLGGGVETGMSFSQIVEKLGCLPAASHQKVIPRPRASDIK